MSVAWGHSSTVRSAKARAFPGGYRFLNLSIQQYKDGKPQTVKLKERRAAGGISAEDLAALKQDLESRERAAIAASSSSSSAAAAAAAVAPVPAKGSEKLTLEDFDDTDLVYAAAAADERVGGDSSGSGSGSDDSDSDDSDSDEEDEAVLIQRQLELLRKKREEEEEAKRALTLEHSNPLRAADGGEVQFGVKRRWNDDVIFRNQAGAQAAPHKQQKRFVNDTVRSDFHRSFLQRYIK